MKTPNLNGWEKLIRPYFAPTCRRVLGQYLEGNGFTETALNEVGGLTFSRLGIFLEITYELELVPQALSVVLGIGDKKYDSGGHPCCVPYWYLLPSVMRGNLGEQIKFKTEADLEALLPLFKNTFLEPYAKPLWINLERLETAIANFRSEFNC